MKGRHLKGILALVVVGALLTFTLSLVDPPRASADLKSVFTAVCDAHDDTVISTAGPTPDSAPDGKPVAFCSASDCRSLMVCMDEADWHVIHDTRYGGAWSENTGGTTTGAFYKLIFEKD